MPSAVDRAGSTLSVASSTGGEPSPLGGVLAAAVAIARGWAPDALAVIAGGSHAAGEAVTARLADRAWSLSDVDLWLVVPDEAAKRAAVTRAARARPGLAGRLLDIGLAAPLDAGFLTPRDLAALPASPAIHDLRRRGRVVAGDPAWLDRVPAWTPADVSREETALLLENRGLELLHAFWGTGADDPLARLQARHATLKSALDLATVVALDHGELPAGPDARVQAARAALERAARPGEGALAARLEPLWREALAWRQSPAPGDRAGARAEWLRAVQAWTSVWLAFTARDRAGAESDPYRRALLWARRARLRRRLRQAATFESRGGAPSAPERIAFALRGTPQHRVNASAAVLLLAAAHGVPAGPSLGPSARRALAGLGVAPATAEWEVAARAVVRAWDAWVLDGQRTAAWA